jgi:hypothetical protein
VLQLLVLLLNVAGTPNGERGDAGQEYDEHHARQDGSALR